MTDLALRPLRDRAFDVRGAPILAAVPRLAVVVPARNEERRLPRCLDALEAAEARRSAKCPSGDPTRVIVVLDCCTDRSAELLDDRPWVEVVISEHGQVGAARAAGIAKALEGNGTGRRSDWIACTDADSAVPTDWLLTQLSHALSGTDLLLGLVQPDPAELTPELLNSWISAHRLADGHPHIHGANLGVSAEMYWRAGGFPQVAVHEDVLLTERIRELGGRVVSTAESPVLTSARTSGRAPAGMAGYLADLGARQAGARG